MNLTAMNLHLLLAGGLGVSALAEKPTQPNIVYFLVDDLGHADVGFTGSKEIRTPQIDKLARGGAILDSFYIQPVCSPVRPC